MTRPGSGDTHVIVGAGQAGAYAAIAMRRAGFEGRIVLVGDEPLLPYDRHPLSKAYLLGRDGKGLTYFFDAATYARERIELELGTPVEAVDAAARRLGMADGRSIPYDRLVLATGSHPRRLNLPGGERVITLRREVDAATIRAALAPGRSLVCIGAGVIGLEIASAGTAHGCRVTVVDVAASAMCRSLLPELAGHVTDLHRRAGVDFRFGTRVAAVKADAVVLSDGERLPADLVVAGIGAERNLALARQAGLEVGRGVFTDAHGRTNRAELFAAGEIAEYYSERTGRYVALESWRHAQEHGAFIGRVAAGVDEVYDEVPWFWSDQQGSNIQVAGDTAEAARVAYRGEPGSAAFSAFLLDARGRLTGAFAINAGRDVSAALRLMQRGDSPDPDMLTNTAIPPQRLLKPRAQQQAGG